MRLTDATDMGPEAHRTTEQLQAAVIAAEVAMEKAGDGITPAAHPDGHLVGFSTALTDEERQYLDMCAELYARGKYGRKPCSES